MENPSSELQVGDENRRKIRKAFNLLKSHASAVASFTLQWQDLEDHLNSIQNDIQSATFHLQNQNPNPKPKPSPKPKTSHFLGIPIGDGAKLLLYLKGRAKDLESVRDGVRGALGASGDPARLVLAAVKGFFLPTGSPDSELRAVRKSCLLLLEELTKAAPEIGADVREDAAAFAAEWKEKITGSVNPTEALGFLMLLNGYGLVGQFDKDEIVKLFENVTQRKQAVELFTSLGLSDKANDFIQNLISQKKNTEALRFVYAFELVDKFAPVPLLQEHVKEAKKVSKTAWKNAKSSKEKDDATNIELAALRSVIKCIEEYKLESEYSVESLKERIEWRKSQKKERKAREKMGKEMPLRSHGTLQQQLSGTKRMFSETRGAQSGNPHNRNTHPRAGLGPARAPIAVHPLHHHRPPGFMEGERMEYMIPSAMMSIPPAGSPNIHARAAATAVAAHSMHNHRPMRLLDGEGRQYLLPPSSNFYSSAQASSHYHHQPSGSFSSQEAQYSPTHHNLSRPAIETRTNLPPPGSHERYNLTGYVPDTQRTSTVRYGVASSEAENIDSLVERYGQFGQPRAQPSDVPLSASPRSSLAYYPAEPSRSVSSGSNYDSLPNGSYAAYHA